MALIIDARERKSIKQFAADQVVVETLDVGDILCKYEDGSGWIAERKTTGNLFCPWHNTPPRTPLKVNTTLAR